VGATGSGTHVRAPTHRPCPGPPVTRGRAGLGYQPALDGLRGLAVAAVLAFHTGFGWARGGFLGVSAFFTLSGFLITTLLLAEATATGRIRLRAFWARRFRRLLPAAMLTLGGIVLFGAVVADANQLRALRGDVLAALADVANWRFVFRGNTYADLFAQPSPVQHFWSLAIEEQFYATFPVLVAGVVAMRRRARPALFVVLAALAAVSITLTFVLRDPGSDVGRVYYGTDTRAVELLAGALLAVASFGPRRDHRRRCPPLLTSTGLTALIVMVVIWATTGQNDEWLYRGGLTLHAALSVLVIAAAVRPGPLRSLLAVEPLRRLGVISYGVYLFHWPVFLWLSAERTGMDGWLLFALRASVTLALADLSYRFVEAPIRAGHRLRGRRPWLTAPAAVAAVTVALVAVTTRPPAPPVVLSASVEAAPPPLAPNAVPVSALQVKASPTTLTAPSEPMKIMVVGDSVAQTLGRGLEEWARITGRARVWNVATRWCGIGRGGVMPLRDSGAECNRWAERWSQQLDRFDPDVVVVLSTIWDLIARKLPEWREFREPGDPVYDAWLRSEYGAAADLLASRGARVTWLTPPCGREENKRIERINFGVIRPMAAARSTVQVVDLDAKLCPSGTFLNQQDGIDDIRPDGAHFSDRGALWLSEWLGPMLLAPEPPRTRAHIR
jgi:peptidoglycan/LPS O-acetylase OafA/YrhL